MRYLILISVLLALVGCTAPPPPVDPLAAAQVPQSQPPPPSNLVTFVAQGGPVQLYLVERNTYVQIDGSGWATPVTAPLHVRAVALYGLVFSSWEGVDWSSGVEAEVYPPQIGKTVTVVVAPVGGG